MRFGKAAVIGGGLLGVGLMIASSSKKSASSSSSSSKGPNVPAGHPSSPPATNPGGHAMPTLQGMQSVPPGGFTGGRALLANYVAPGRWLESPETIEGALTVATDRTTLGRWSQRDDQVVNFWLPRQDLSIPAWVDVDMTHLFADGTSHTLTVTVSADAVLLGGDIRTRNSILAAQCIADAYDAMLPTFGIVDAAWAAAFTKLPPHDLVPSPVTPSQMMSIAAWLLEDTLIGNSLSDWYAAWASNPAPTMPPAGQVAGLIRTIGKEYVMHPGLVARPNHGTMYGWQELDGRVQQSPIDGASFFHEATYFDYSQVTTLVKKQAVLDGKPVALADIYQHFPALVMQGRTDPVPIRHPLVPPLAA